jgi:hypothetical protein
LFYSGATGFIMRYLWTQEREKGKHELAAEAESRVEDVARLDRLSESESEAGDLQVEAQRPAQIAKSNS